MTNLMERSNEYALKIHEIQEDMIKTCKNVSKKLIDIKNKKEIKIPQKL